MFIILPLALVVAFLPRLATAIQVLPPCTATGNCQLCDFVLGFMNIMRWGFGIVGAVAILFLIIAGLGWIMSQGSPDKIKKAKNRVIGVVTGLAIMLVAWQVTNFLVAAFALNNNPGQAAKIQTSPSLFSFNNGTVWYNVCSGSLGARACSGRGDGAPCEQGAGYCLKGQCQSGGKLACEFLSTDPDFKKYFTNYACQEQSLCDFNQDLGQGYCGGDDYENTHCCLPKNLTTPNP
ncbi:MAG: pilin [Candidatus Komeilibacteria bacterium]|nr:pilin [Candidatus Komeilibacteria bacterium]